MRKNGTKSPFFGKISKDLNSLFNERKEILEEKNELLTRIVDLILKQSSLKSRNQKLHNDVLFKKIQARYQKIRNRIIKQINQYPMYKVKIAFLVSENQKWNCQSLYEALETHPKFEPIVLITPLAEQNIDKICNQMKINFDFFKKRKMRVKKVYDVKKRDYISLDKIAPEIIFYQQPWGLAHCQKIEQISKYALTAYIPYSFRLFDYDNNYLPNFHALLWIYFVETDYHQSLIEKFSNYDNCIVSGYPKLDVYHQKKINGINPNYWSSKKTKDKNIKRIIYAPHHSITPTPLALATFVWSGDRILRLAQNSPHTEWIFKPHPNLMFNFINSFPKLQKYIENYYQEWNNLINARIYDQGDYFDIFRSADAMITDSGSFLAEFLPTGKPVIHLINKHQNVPFNKIGMEIIKTYYQVGSIKELDLFFSKVVINGEDYMKKSRMALIRKFDFLHNTSTENIIYELEKALCITK